MGKVYSNLTELIGGTPLVDLRRFVAHHGLTGVRLLAKIESFNPGGSVKDRASLFMIEEAERAGRLKAGGTIIEPTSGNTGIGLAWIGAVKGYRVILTMPASMSIERRKILTAYGAEIVLTPAEEGMKGAIRVAEELRQATEGAITIGQFDNPNNPAAHEHTTAEEIWRDTGGKVDVLVACVGTGGTVSGTGRVLKQRNSNLRVVAVEPADSPVLSGGKAAPHPLQGIGAGFVPMNFDRSVVDAIYRADNKRAFTLSRELAKLEGILAGISSGAALEAALDEAARVENTGATIVVVLPDTGERYLSASLFEE